MRILIIFLISLTVLNLSLPVNAGPNLNGPSGLITLPTANLSAGMGTHIVDGNRFYKYNMLIFSGYLEAGVTQNKATSSETYHAKLALMKDSWILPSVAIGMTDLSDSNRESSKYLVVSKSIGTLGLVVHGGYIQFGKVHSVAGMLNYNYPFASFNDLQKTRKLGFLAVEYSFLPLVSLMGEFADDTINAGIRVSPSMGLTVDWNYLDIKNKNKLKDRRLVNVKYKFGF